MAASMPILHSYFRSTCSWRVRTTLALKGIDYEYKGVNLLKGEQLSDAYLTVNPMGQVPALEIDGLLMTQSLPIIEYLDETIPNCSLFPKDPIKRYMARQVAETINAGIQPVQNLSMCKFVGAERKMELGNTFITKGFVALEKTLASTSGKYCIGDEVTVADVFLVPQVYNANRFKVDMSAFPVISKINDVLGELDAFKASHPSKQPDCPEDLRQ
ncbi:maleylacetoacetate isomerase isoform X1 [Strongylocentrotus purpuratus]|uniref:maleylacetoacetate isomerase n=1 Tax=Strongylocentrotus purpuratus TaxID=7668 RepID=A0A7M7RBZ7_STRPU|nr:maleylacetoacetate isomerase isoform X1 [Strongylocentrotus purpuratus]|eukprot:XP_785986.1 PREDICTED: maleylacetoacetate isomerase isoform X1 [Strongylocentrotus purpuratus]